MGGQKKEKKGEPRRLLQIIDFQATKGKFAIAREIGKLS